MGGGGGGVVVVVEWLARGCWLSWSWFLWFRLCFFVSFVAVALLAVKMDVRYGGSSPPNRMNYYGNYK